MFALGNPNTPVDLLTMLIVNGAFVNVLDAERDGAINYLYDTRTRRNEREFLGKLRIVVEKMDFSRVQLETTWPRTEDIKKAYSLDKLTAAKCLKAQTNTFIPKSVFVHLINRYL